LFACQVIINPPFAQKGAIPAVSKSNHTPTELFFEMLEILRQFLIEIALCVSKLKIENIYSFRLTNLTKHFFETMLLRQVVPFVPHQ
jgi:hypothetical protein